MNPNQINNGQVQNQQQTQVLNLNDVEQVAKEEKKASLPKKLAVCLFAIGVLAIVGGFSYNSIASMLGLDTSQSGKTEETTTNDTDDNGKAATVEDTTASTTCQKATPSQPNGTDKQVTYELSFDEESKLQNYTKTMVLTPTTGNSTGPVTINTLKTGYTAIAAYQIPGYTLAVTPTNDGTVAGLQIAVTIDLVNLDTAKYASYKIVDEVSKVDLKLNDTKEAVVNYLTTNGYECK